MALTTPPIVIEHGQEQTFEWSLPVSSGTTASIDRGTPTKNTTAKAAIMVDANGTTSELFRGIAKGASTETSSAAGRVALWFPAPGVVYRTASKTSTNSNTQAKIDALQGKRVVFDLTGTVWSIDDGASDATTNCLYICGGNPLTSELLFVYQVNGSLANPTT